MSSRKKKKKKGPIKQPGSPATFHNTVLQAIRQHARLSPNFEICGVLIGRKTGSGTMVNGAIAGEGASQGQAHVTFTQETWTKIHEEKDKRFPGQAIVGWYHSHPGFGVFLSDHDVFIQKHFFSDPGSLAWVYDPHSDEEGCFGWDKGKVCRLTHYEVVADGGKKTGSRSEPTPESSSITKSSVWGFPRYRFGYKTFLSIFAIVALFGSGFLFGWYFPAGEVPGEMENGSTEFKEQDEINRDKDIDIDPFPDSGGQNE